MDYETKITDTMHGGKKCETSVTLGAAPSDSMNDLPGERVLVLATRKGSNGRISAFASVCVDRDTGRGYRTRTSAIFQDYAQTIAVAPQGTRATEKNLLACHNEALLRMPDIIAACMAKYYPVAA